MKKTSKLYIINLYFISAFILLIQNNAALANTNPSEYNTLLAKQCFLTNNIFTHQKLAEDKSQDLVLFKVEKNYWHEQLKIINQNKPHKQCGKFENVNLELAEYNQNLKILDKNNYNNFLNYLINQYNKIKINKENNKFYKNTVIFNQDKKNIINNLFDNIKADRISSSLKEFSSFYNRAGYTNDGVKAAEHLKQQIEELAAKNNLTKDTLTVELVSTIGSGYKQPSVVVRYGNKENIEDALVISAHMDTLGGRMPGADDDGSGSMTVLETARVLINSKQGFTKPIYFMWYAAEEMGLVGSKVVVRKFNKEKINIDSVLNLDTIGKRASDTDPTVWFLRDNVDNSFTDYLVNLTKEHINIPVKFTTCGYACSDHAVWNRYGYVSAAGFESSFDDINQNLHSQNDTQDKISIDNLVNFTKLALAYVVDRASIQRSQIS